MPTKIRLEHIGAGYIKLWKSDGMQAAVDEAGERIASEAWGNTPAMVETYRYYAKPGNFTAMGFVSSTGVSGAIYQQQDNALARAVHP